MQCPLDEWGHNRTPMRGRTPDVIDRPGRLCSGVRDLLQTRSVDGLSTQEHLCRGRSDHGRRHRTEGDLDLLAYVRLCP
jgi:hypothetical protein